MVIILGASIVVSPGTCLSETYRIFPAIRQGFRPFRMTSNNLISPMKFCYNTNSTLPKQCQSSRSVLQDGSRTFGLFWKEKTLSYNRRNAVCIIVLCYCQLCKLCVELSDLPLYCNNAYTPETPHYMEFSFEFCTIISGVRYIIDKSLGNCSILPLTNTSGEATPKLNSEKAVDSYMLNLKNPLQLFNLGWNYTYIGQVCNCDNSTYFSTYKYLAYFFVC